jgi:hypothetical protein
MPIFPAALEYQPYRRPREAVFLPEYPLNVTRIAVLYVLWAIGEDHEARWVGAYLGSIVKLEPLAPHQVRLMALDRFFQRVVNLSRS